MPGDLDGLAVGLALFEEEVKQVQSGELRARFGARSSGPEWLGRVTLKLSVVTALGLAVFSVAQAISVFP